MVVSGMLAFLLSLVVLTSRTATVTVFVAKDDVVAGKSISTSQFSPIEIPSCDLNGQYVTKVQLTSGKKYFAARSILKGEPLVKGALTPEADQSNVRLQSIPIDKSLAVAGALSRGDRIDVISTPEDDCAVRVLRNLEVIVSPKSSGGGGLAGGSNSYVITVAIERAGDDLTLAGIISTGEFQVVKTTGTNDNSAVLTDPYCENGLDESSVDEDSGGA